jgi:hypothetical protein
VSKGLGMDLWIKNVLRRKIREEFISIFKMDKFSSLEGRREVKKEHTGCKREISHIQVDFRKQAEECRWETIVVVPEDRDCTLKIY